MKFEIGPPLCTKNVKIGTSHWRSKENCRPSHSNSGTVSHIHFKLGTGIGHPSGIRWRDSSQKVEGQCRNVTQRIQIKIAITQYCEVQWSSYLVSNMGTTPQLRDAKWLPWRRQLPSNWATKSAIYGACFKNAKVYKHQNKCICSTRASVDVTQFW